jgi:hypothetical protein
MLMAITGTLMFIRENSLSLLRAIAALQDLCRRTAEVPSLWSI